MPLPQWPADVPACPLLDTTQVQQTADAPIRTEMNAGTTRARRKFTLRIARMTFSLRMTNAQVVAFRTFHEETLSDGAARFQMPILFAGTRRVETAQFAEQPAYDSLGGKLTRVSISLRVENLGTGALYVPEPPEEPEPPDYTPSLDFSNPLNSGYVAAI